MLRGILSRIVKLIVIVSVVYGLYLCAGGGKRAFMGGGTMYMYFTIQSNIAVAVLCLIGLTLMSAGKEDLRVWSVVRFMGTVAITLTGMVYCFVLAPTIGRGAWRLNNVLTHVVVPVGSVVDFLLTGGKGELRTSDAKYVVIPPLLYVIYATVGYARGWNFGQGANYPYFFLNWGSPVGAFGLSRELPFMGCVWWILALLAFLVGVGRLYLFLVGVRKKK